MEIRSVEKNDLDDLVKLNNSEAGWIGGKDRLFFEKYMKIPFFWIIGENRKINAFMMVMDRATDYGSKNFVWFKDRLNEFYYVDRVVVERSIRRMGLGRELYSRLIERRENVPIVAEVSINPENTESIRFHEFFGFKNIGTFSADNKKTCTMYLLS